MNLLTNIEIRILVEISKILKIHNKKLYNIYTKLCTIQINHHHQ